MKAVGYYQSLPIDHPDALLDLELPEPTPGPRDLLVEVRAISVNPVDTRSASAPSRKPARPRCWAGMRRAWCARSAARSACSVLAIGSGTPETSPAPVATAHRVDERIVGHLPKSLDFAQAAALPLTTITAWELLFERLQIAEGKADQGQSLLVVGAAGGSVRSWSNWPGN